MSGEKAPDTFGVLHASFLDAAFQSSEIGSTGGDRMKPYPRVEELLAPVLQRAMHRAAGSPAFLRRYNPHVGDRQPSPCLRKFNPMETERCLVFS